MSPRGGVKKSTKSKTAETYQHPESTSPMRPEVGTQAQFKKKKAPHKYRYDDSLSPALEWDGNPARERGEERIARAEQELAEAQRRLVATAKPEEIEEAAARVAAAQESVRELKAMSKPFLNWAGKAERLSFDVPTLPLFIHERLSTKAILETLKGHKRDKQADMFDLFGDPQHSFTDQVMRAYEFPDEWVNRMILGDSLVVMNSLLRYENLGGQVQMIYMDPPYGISFGSNFQPFVRNRDVFHNNDESMTREPEMVAAYRDTWELGLHSYLTYLRDRLVLARELLAKTGSIFVQINDANVHHVRELLDEVFGSDCCLSVITFRKKTMPMGSGFFEQVADTLLWYARDRESVRVNPVFKRTNVEGDLLWCWMELEDGSRRKLSSAEIANHSLLPKGGRIYRLVSMLPAQYRPKQDFIFTFNGKRYSPPASSCWKTDREGMEALVTAKRLQPAGETLQYVMFLDDYPYSRITSLWDDTGGASDKVYVVQTSTTVVQRCLLAATAPGDLVFDPTCGGGTTAYVAEQWGRRWITCDTSRVPLALARQRLLTATFGWYELKDDARGPAAGFVYQRKQNNRGQEVGGIVPHITLGSITNSERAAEEVLVDRPEILSGIVRVTGPFCVEATIPTEMNWEDSAGAGAPREDGSSAQFIDRMIEVLRKSPVLHLEGNKTVTLKNIRLPAKTLSLSAEATIDATANGHRATLEDAMQEAKEKSGLSLPLSQKPVAIVFGPENGAVTEALVRAAHDEASMKSKGYNHLYVIGFAIEPNARQYIEHAAQLGVPATYAQATPDLTMGDLLKNMRSSQIFSVTGLPDAVLRKAKKENGAQFYEVELRGLDVFDPVTMEALHRSGEEVPAWFLDTDYNGLCFHVSQAFFPKTGAWENLKKALRAEYEEGVWDHLAGTVSAPFEAGEKKQVAIKVIDERGNELLVVKTLAEAK